MNPLIQAIKNKNINQLKLLIELGHDLNVRDEGGGKLLNVAAKVNALECAKVLIDRGFDVNESGGWYGETPIYYAAGFGHVEMVRLLLLKGADITLEERYDPFQELTKEKELELFQNLKINDVKNTNSQKEVIKRALYRNYTDFLNGVFLDGFDVNVELENGNRPIHLATAELTALLINLGADINIKNHYGSTPLQSALSKSGGYINIRDINIKRNDNQLKIRLLIESNAVIESTDNDLCTPLHIACQYCSTEEHLLNTALFFIDQGVNLEVRDSKGQTPLYCLINAIAKRLFYNKKDSNNCFPDDYFKLIKTLTCKGCNINALNILGQTPLLSLFEIEELKNRNQLHKCLISYPKSYLHFIAFLIETGADVNAEDHSGTTPLIACAKNEFFAGYKILLENGADEYKKNQFGESAKDIIKSKASARKSELVHIAIKYQDFFLMKLVLESGFDIDKKNYKKNLTPLFYAIEFYHPQIFELLILHGASPELLPPPQQNKCAILLNQLKAQKISAILQSLIKHQES